MLLCVKKSGATAAGREFWPALGFSLWVSIASTTLAALAALLLAVLLTNRQRPTGRSTLLALHFNLAFPHLVWAIALSLLLAQSGLLARIAAALGLITTPADFPVLVRDRYGLGIILHYVTKEIPFLTLIVLAVLRAQSAPYDLVAENLGANFWQRLLKRWSGLERWSAQAWERFPLERCSLERLNARTLERSPASPLPRSPALPPERLSVRALERLNA